MAKYRNKVKIVADLLTAARTGAKKTHIMYKCNLSYRVAIAYLNTVLRAGLLVFNSDNAIYSITDKGKMFLEKFNKYNRYAKNFEKQHERLKNQTALLEQMCFGSNLPDNDNCNKNNRTNMLKQISD